MPEDFEEFARIVARNFPDEEVYEEIPIVDFDFNTLKSTNRSETFTVAWIPGFGRIDIVFTPDYE